MPEITATFNAETINSILLLADRTIREDSGKGDKGPDDTVLELMRTLQERAKNALLVKELRARVPRVIPELKVGASILWEKDYETEDEQIVTRATELVVAEVIFAPDYELYQCLDDKAIVRLLSPYEECPYLVLSKRPRGWVGSALCRTLDQALEFFRPSDTSHNVIHAYLKRKVNLIADTEGVSKEEKAEMVNAVLSGELIKKLDGARLNLAGDIQREARNRHLIPFE